MREREGKIAKEQCKLQRQEREEVKSRKKKSGRDSEQREGDRK